jgi:serine/threonine protein kinase/tetratricopeptide (TPR) repeat protein
MSSDPSEPHNTGEERFETVAPATDDLGSLEFELRAAMGTGSGSGPSIFDPPDDAAHGDAETLAAGPVPGDVIGDFEILSELGRGGMGVVYRARQTSLNRMVALKLLHADFASDPERVVRFRHECMAAAKLSHRSIVPIYAQGQHGPVLYFAMELIEGESLAELKRRQSTPGDPVRRGASDPDPDAADFNLVWANRFVSVAEALDHAHRNAIVHRDVKPANLILDEAGLLHVLDFGVARVIDAPAMTVTGQMLGTPSYLAPEQVGAEMLGDDAAVEPQHTSAPTLSATDAKSGVGSERSDIYALGVTLYEMVTGCLPHEATNLAALLRQIAEEEPIPPRRHNPAVSRNLEAVILKAIEKRPERRYATAADFARDLRAVATGLPIEARRTTAAERLWHDLTARPTTIALVGVVLIGALGLLVSGQILLFVAGLVALAVGGVAIRQLRRREGRRLSERALQLLLHESYSDLTSVRPMLARAGRLAADDDTYVLAQSISELGESPQRAEDRLRKFIERQPNHRVALLVLAWIGRLTNDDDAIQRWLKRADETGVPRTAEEYFLRGLACMHIDNGQALDDLRKAIQLRSDFSQALLHLGRALNQWIYYHRRLEHVDEQIAALTSLCLLRPDAAYPRYLLSIAHRLIGETHDLIAEQSDDIVDREVNERQAKRCYGLAYQAAKDAQRIEPTSGRGYAAEAYCFERMGDYVAAIAAWDHAFRHERFHQTRAEVHLYRARLAWWTGELERALWDLRALQMLSPDDPFALVLYPAIMLAEAGRRFEAMELLRQAETSPHLPREELNQACVITDLLLGIRSPNDADLVSFDPLAEDPDRLARGVHSPRERFLAGVTALARGERTRARAWFEAAARTFDNQNYCFDGRAFATKLDVASDFVVPIGPHPSVDP